MTARYTCALARPKNDKEWERIKVLGATKLVKSVIGLPKDFDLGKINTLLKQIQISEELLSSIDGYLPSFVANTPLQLIWFNNEIREDDLADWLEFMYPVVQDIDIRPHHIDLVEQAFAYNTVQARHTIEDFLCDTIKAMLRGKDDKKDN